MTREEFENLIDEKYAEIEKALAETKKELLEKYYKEQGDDLEIGEDYYYITSTGDVLTTKYYGCPDNLCHVSIGNFFHTREEAEFEVERLKVIAEMKKYAKKFVRGNTNYFFCCSRDKKLDIEYWMDSALYGLCFDKENIVKCRETVGEDRIKKYYLRVEDE